MQDNIELQNRREKLIKNIGKSLGLTDFSNESFEAERVKIQNELEKLDPKRGDFNIKLDELVLKYDKKLKSDLPLEKCEAMSDYKLELFKLQHTHLFFSEHSLMTIHDLESVLSDVEMIIMFSGKVSLVKKLFAIKEVRNLVLRSDAKARQLLEVEKYGLVESNSKEILLAMKQQIPKQVYSNPDALMFTPLITDPLFVAKTHIPMYGRILELLDREQNLLEIELRNGKSLDYSPLNDDKANGNPTTSAPVEESEPKVKPQPPQWKMRALFMFYRKKIDSRFSYQDTLAYFECQDISGKSNYNQLHKAYAEIEGVKDRCLETNRQYILTAIQELEKLESCKKSLEIARAEYNDFNVNYPIS